MHSVANVALGHAMEHKYTWCVLLEATRSCCAGRPLACQLSVASGIPLTALLLRGLPTADGSAGAVDRYAAPYAALLFIMGTLVSWPQVLQPYNLKP